MNRLVASGRQGGSRLTMFPGAVLLLAATLSWAVPVGSQSIDAASEQSIKAAYLYKFADYVEWPEEVLKDTNTPLTIGVVGADAIAYELEEVTRGRAVHGRPIRVRRVEGQEGLEGLHVLFVGTAGTDDLRNLTDMASRHSVLVVTESRNALERGSVINFRAIDQRIRFEVSLDAADRSRLRLSARLLAVAVHVQPRTD
jgi:hypothetical protein